MSLIFVTCFSFQLSLCVQLLRSPNVIGSLPENNCAGPFLASSEGALCSQENMLFLNKGSILLNSLACVFFFYPE